MADLRKAPKVEILELDDKHTFVVEKDIDEDQFLTIYGYFNINQEIKKYVVNRVNFYNYYINDNFSADVFVKNKIYRISTTQVEMIMEHHEINTHNDLVRFLIGREFIEKLHNYKEGYMRHEDIKNILALMSIQTGEIDAECQTHND